MSLPEKKQNHKTYKRHFTGDDIPVEFCHVDCPACLEAARDKEWAQFILTKQYHPVWGWNEFAALKKMAEG